MSCTSVSLFVDTNVLVYSRDTADATMLASARAWVRRLWETGDGRLKDPFRSSVDDVL